MTTEAALLTLSQWLSPAYPVGAFAYSHGLEALADTGQVRGTEDLQHWLEDLLRHGAGHNDALLLAAAYHAKDTTQLVDIDQTARAFCASRERLFETDQQGRAFCTITAAVWQTELRGLCYPVALGRAAALENLPLDLTLILYLQAFMANLVSAGQRLLPVGQTAGQTLIRDLTPLCREVAAAARAGDLSDLSSSLFLGDIASMRHETQYSRIFRT
ncbi:MAG: urease accessory protein UreF [Pelagimonas sp.]|jgi:urease accessory protein|nr:urease accessory protein UreF [Pelagimonas sp.]